MIFINNWLTSIGMGKGVADLVSSLEPRCRHIWQSLKPNCAFDFQLQQPLPKVWQRMEKLQGIAWIGNLLLMISVLRKLHSWMKPYYFIIIVVHKDGISNKENHQHAANSRHKLTPAMLFKILHLFCWRDSYNNSELKQVTFLTTRTAWVTSEDWVKGCDWWKTSILLPVDVRVVKNVTCLSSLMSLILYAIT